MVMFTKLTNACMEIRAFYKERLDFILFRFWQIFSTLSIFYFVCSLLVAPFVLSGILSVEQWGRMSMGFLVGVSILLGFLLLILFALSLFRIRRGKFDSFIKYREINLNKRLTSIETRLDNFESRLDKVEKDIRTIKRQVSQLSKVVKAISELIVPHKDRSN